MNFESDFNFSEISNLTLTFRLKSDRNYLGKVLLENLPEPKMQVLSDLAEFLNFVIFL